MKLLYRGINYNRKASTKLVGLNELTGKYRGATWHSFQADTNNINQHKYDLTYRGVRYH